MVTVLGTSMVLNLWLTVAAWVVGGHTGTPLPLESSLKGAGKRCRSSDEEAKRLPDFIDSQNCHVNNIGGEPAIRSRFGTDPLGRPRWSGMEDVSPNYW